MEKIIYDLAFNQEKKLTAEGEALILVEAVRDNEKRYLSTKVFIRPDQWDSSKREVRNHPNMKTLNKYLYDLIAALEKRELDMILKGERFELDDVLGNKPQHLSFIDFMNREIGLSHLKFSTQKNHYSTLKVLSLYKPDLLIHELTYTFLCDFESFLLDKDYHINTISKHMRHLKRYVNLAINKDLFDIVKYPFRKYKIHHVESPRVHLTPEELKKFEKIDVGKRKALRKALDIFLFCCYTGLRFSDIVKIRRDNFQYIDGKLWLIFSSTKTKADIRLPVYLLFEGKAVALSEKYTVNPSFFDIDINSNSNINKQLRVISQLAGIKKNISFHTARHTNATLLLYNGAHITTVQKLLGHKSVKTTEIYSKIMDMTIVRDLEKIY
ncbi:MAG: site-specific integrase [Tannerellaceae bacterium]|jgi:integrase|nr:site-specific integrase [Tannerellaceae bacterium]